MKLKLWCFSHNPIEHIQTQTYITRKMTITSDNYDYLRTDILFEWTFAVLVINLTLQIYRLVAQVASLVFDVFKLTYGKSLFGPLTDTDLKAYGNYFTARNELLFKLSESVVLLITAYYGAKSLLNFSVLGLAIQSVIFILHVIVLTLGIIFLVGKFHS